MSTCVRWSRLRRSMILAFLFAACPAFGEEPTAAPAVETKVETKGEPKTVVQDIFARAGEPDAASSAAKQGEINGHVDFDALARAALGKEAKKAAPSDVQWFGDTLKEIITRTVYPKAPDFLKDVKIVYNSVDTKGAKSRVKSTVQNKADLTDVDYELARGKDGSWKVVDVAIAGQSWVESIREQVSDELRKSKWKGLRSKMNKKLSDIKAGKG